MASAQPTGQASHVETAARASLAPPTDPAGHAHGRLRDAGRGPRAPLPVRRCAESRPGERAPKGSNHRAPFDLKEKQLRPGVILAECTFRPPVRQNWIPLAQSIPDRTLEWCLPEQVSTRARGRQVERRAPGDARVGRGVPRI